MKRDAYAMANDMGILKNSITAGEGNEVGFIGELAVSYYTGFPLTNTYDYDMMIKSVTVDVKTKKCSSEPLPHYECSVSAYNPNQNCQIYFFVRYSEEYNMAWLLGWIGKDDFFQKSRFLRKGQYDTSNGYTVRGDCYNIPISKLRSFEFMKNDNIDCKKA